MCFLTVFNQRSLYNAYKKRTKNVEVTMEEYIEAQKADPDFYRDGTSLQYGKVQPHAPSYAPKNITHFMSGTQIFVQFLCYLWLRLS